MLLSGDTPFMALLSYSVFYLPVNFVSIKVFRSVYRPVAGETYFPGVGVSQLRCSARKISPKCSAHIQAYFDITFSNAGRYSSCRSLKVILSCQSPSLLFLGVRCLMLLYYRLLFNLFLVERDDCERLVLFCGIFYHGHN